MIGFAESYSVQHPYWCYILVPPDTNVAQSNIKHFIFCKLPIYLKVVCLRYITYRWNLKEF